MIVWVGEDLVWSHKIGKNKLKSGEIGNNNTDNMSKVGEIKVKMMDEVINGVIQMMSQKVM